MNRKHKGILLQINRVKDQHCFFQFLDSEEGLLSIYAPRILKIQHPYHALCQCPQILELETRRMDLEKGLEIFQEGDIIASFPHLQKEIFKQAYFSEYIELLKDLLQSQEKGREFYALTSYFLYCLDQSYRKEEILLTEAKLRALALAGFLFENLQFFPHSSRNTWIFSPLKYELSMESKNFLLKTQSVPLPKLFSPVLNEQTEREVCIFAERYLELCLDKVYDRTAYRSSLYSLEDWAQSCLRERRGD